MSTKTPINYDDVPAKILSIENKEIQFLIALQYITARRVGELLKKWHKVIKPEILKMKRNVRKFRIQKAPKKHLYIRMTDEEKKECHWICYYTESIKLKDFRDKGDYVTLFVNNFKSRIHPFLWAIIPKKGKDAWIWEEVLEPFLKDKVNKNFPEDAQLARYGYEKTKKLINQEMHKLGIDFRARKLFTSHHLRHSRLTHLREIFNLDAYEIKAIAGHTKLEVSMTYVDVNPQQIAEKIIK